jgi:hypothetical protein
MHTSAVMAGAQKKYRPEESRNSNKPMHTHQQKSNNVFFLVLKKYRGHRHYRLLETLPETWLSPTAKNL